MKIFTRFPAFLSVSALLLSLSGCDRSLDLSNDFDGSVTIGNYFEKKFTAERYYLEDLVSLDDIADMNHLDRSITWDMIESLAEPMLIPNLSFGPFRLSDMSLSEKDIEILTNGNGKLYVTLEAVSSLPVNVDISIDFIAASGEVTNIFGDNNKVMIYGTGDGTTPPATTESNSVEISEGQLHSILNATAIGGSIVNENLWVTLRRDAYVDFTFTVTKTGGFSL